MVGKRYPPPFVFSDKEIEQVSFTENLTVVQREIVTAPDGTKTIVEKPKEESVPTLVEFFKQKNREEQAHHYCMLMCAHKRLKDDETLGKGLYEAAQYLKRVCAELDERKTREPIIGTSKGVI